MQPSGYHLPCSEETHGPQETGTWIWRQAQASMELWGRKSGIVGSVYCNLSAKENVTFSLFLLESQVRSGWLHRLHSF